MPREHRQCRARVEQKKAKEKRKDRETGVNEGKSVVWQEGTFVKENTEKGLRRGIKVLKEIKEYLRSTDLLIRRLPFQMVVREITKISEQINGSKFSHHGPPRGRRGLSSRTV